MPPEIVTTQVEEVDTNKNQNGQSGFGYWLIQFMTVCSNFVTNNKIIVIIFLVLLFGSINHSSYDKTLEALKGLEVCIGLGGKD